MLCVSCNKFYGLQEYKSNCSNCYVENYPNECKEYHYNLMCNVMKNISFTTNQLNDYIDKYQIKTKLFNVLKSFIIKDYWKTKINIESFFTLLLNNGKLGISSEQGAVLYELGKPLQYTKDHKIVFSEFIGGLILDYWNITKKKHGNHMACTFNLYNEKPCSKIRNTKLQSKEGIVWWNIKN
jgi:hypothetical protein